MDAIARLSTPYLEEILAEKEKVVITGMRSWDEKERFEEETNEEIEVLAVWTPREERKSRKEKRQREEDIVGDEFHERDLREINNGVGKLIALSDHLIKNSNISKQELEEKVNQIVR
jgi:dephospho-CoA kinase